MSDIRVLPDEVADKIAAGEVIERPASVLKELIENSLDAGAAHITIECEKAGKLLIRVRDDGKGMDKEDLRLSIARHATSKISKFDDVYALDTFGFRGEALYSIAAVSRMRMTSFREGEDSARFIETEGGAVKDEGFAPPVKGTAVEVRDLFFNIPARAKFLKSDATERAALIRTVEEAAIANGKVGFKFIVDGTTILSLPASVKEDLAGRAEAVLGKKVFSGMKGIKYSSGGLRVSGYVSRPEYFSGTRANQYYFVNRRPVNSAVLRQAFYKGYPLVPSSRHPAGIILLELSPADFDCNVHPRKTDVKFSKESEIFAVLFAAVSSALETSDHSGVAPQLPRSAGHSSVPTPAFSPEMIFGKIKEKETAYQTVPAPVIFTRGQKEEPSEADIFKADAAVHGSIDSLKTEAAADNKYVPEDAWLTAELFYLGQLVKSYLVFECADGLLLVDQHAAQERVFFERYLEEFSSGKIKIQPMLLPVEAELSRSQVQNVMRWREWLSTAGFEIDERGETSVLLRSAPAFFDFNTQNFTEFSSYLADILGNPASVAEDVKRNIVATMACKKAIKAHDKVGPDGAYALMRDLRAARDASHCPHGRPTVYYMTSRQLAKCFQRTNPLKN